MTNASPSPARIEHLYATAIRLYPARFREIHGISMRQTFRDALDDRTLSRRTLIPLVLRDLATSLAKEHLSMVRDTFGRPALIFNAFVLAGVATVLAMALYTIPQQVLRLGANDPQIALADDLVAKLEQIPVPPGGVFDYVRQHGQERISWQPILGTTSDKDQKSALNGGVTPHGHGVRIAAVVQRVAQVGNAPGGFVLAGRNMREVESREHLVGQLAMLAWLAMLGLIVVATAAFGWFTRPRSLPSAVKAG